MAQHLPAGSAIGLVLPDIARVGANLRSMALEGLLRYAQMRERT